MPALILWMGPEALCFQVVCLCVRTCIRVVGGILRQAYCQLLVVYFLSIIVSLVVSTIAAGKTRLWSDLLWIKKHNIESLLLVLYVLHCIGFMQCVGWVQSKYNELFRKFAFACVLWHIPLFTCCWAFLKLPCYIVCFAAFQHCCNTSCGNRCSCFCVNLPTVMHMLRSWLLCRRLMYC